MKYTQVRRKTYFCGLCTVESCTNWRLIGSRCGMQAMANHGIVGRGVLLDYFSWAQKHGKAYDPFTSHAITVEDLKAVALEQNVKFEVGDILLIRSGYTATYYEAEKSDPQRLVEVGVTKPTFAGVEQSEAMKTWLHDKFVNPMCSYYFKFANAMAATSQP